MRVVCTQEIETLPFGKSKGLGMCVGPQFSETPFFADFLSWYLDMGVDRFYMYAIQANWLLEWVRALPQLAAQQRRSVQPSPSSIAKPLRRCSGGTLNNLASPITKGTESRGDLLLYTPFYT